MKRIDESSKTDFTEGEPATNAPPMLESLTRAWYAFVAFTAAFLFVRDGVGIVSAIVAVGALFGLPFVYLFGRLLRARGWRRVTRALLLIVSALSTISGGIGIAKTIISGGGFFGVLTDVVASAVWVYMHVKSFLVLTSGPVRAHFKYRK